MWRAASERGVNRADRPRMPRVYLRQASWVASQLRAKSQSRFRVWRQTEFCQYIKKGRAHEDAAYSRRIAAGTASTTCPECTIEAQNAIVENVRASMAQTDDLVGRVVEAMDGILLHSETVR